MADEIELVGERRQFANGDESREFRYRGIIFLFVKRSDPDLKNIVVTHSRELHPALSFFQNVGKNFISDDTAMIFGAQCILDKHEDWARKWVA